MLPTAKQPLTLSNNMKTKRKKRRWTKADEMKAEIDTLKAELTIVRRRYKETCEQESAERSRVYSLTEKYSLIKRVMGDLLLQSHRCATYKPLEKLAETPRMRIAVIGTSGLVCVWIDDRPVSEMKADDAQEL